VVYYFGLRKMNDSLLSENAGLRRQLDLLRSMDTLRDSLVHKQLNPFDTPFTSCSLQIMFIGQHALSIIPSMPAQLYYP